MLYMLLPCITQNKSSLANNIRDTSKPTLPPSREPCYEPPFLSFVQDARDCCHDHKKEIWGQRITVSQVSTTYVLWGALLVFLFIIFSCFTNQKNVSFERDSFAKMENCIVEMHHLIHLIHLEPSKRLHHCCFLALIQCLHQL